MMTHVCCKLAEKGKNLAQISDFDFPKLTSKLLFSLKLNDLIALKLNQMRVRKVLRIQWSTQRARSNQIIQLKRASDANSPLQRGRLR